MEYFNFLGLPEVVQDLIVHEIVHNSIPNDRIQLARTCKYLNEAVKRAKPKKIVEKLEISFFNDISFDVGTKIFRSLPTPEFFTNICQILQQFQVEKLKVVTTALDEIETQNSGFFHHLFEASKFVTELKILHHGFLHEFVEFYDKLEHVEFLDYFGSIEMFNSLSHLPSKIKVHNSPDYDSIVLENITKKTKLLSSLFVKRCISVENLQQFLQTGKFKNGCEIYCEVQNSEGKTIHVFMTFIDDEQGFEIETFPKECLLFAADQKYEDKNKRIVTLSTVEHYSNSWMVLFNLTSKSGLMESFICNFLADNEQEGYVFNNVNKNDWIKINFDEDNAYVHYSYQMLESNFPRNDYSSALERLEVINDTLGCQISIIKAEDPEFGSIIFNKLQL